MDRETMLRLREEFDTTSTADSMDGGTWVTEVDPDPMITTSLRLPKSLLDWVRTQADHQGIKPTALIRRWIEEQQRTGDQNSPIAITRRIQALEAEVFQRRSTA